MNVYVVVTHYMQGGQDAGIFSIFASAEAHAKSLGSNGKPTVEQFPVIGQAPTGSELFSASVYDRSLDVHYLVGVYGCFDDAKRAAGPQGQVLARKL